MARGRYGDSARVADYEEDNKRLMAKIERYGVEEVDVSRLKIDEEAAQFREKDAVEILSDSLKRRRRMLNFPIVQKGTYLVISGTHRIQAAKANGQKTIFCHIVDVDDTELWAIRIEENLTRRKTRPQELYHWFRKARDEWGWTHDLMSNLVGLSRGRVTQILNWGDKGQLGVAGDTQPEMLDSNIPRTVDSGPMSVPSVPEISDIESGDDAKPLGGTGAEQALARSVPEGQDTAVLPSHGDLEESTIRAESTPVSSIPPLDAVSFSHLPSGYWTRAEVLQYHGRINGAIQSAAKHLDDPAIREWFESIYRFTKKELGYDI